MIGIVNKLFGALGSNSLKRYSNFVEQVNKHENTLKELTDQKLKEKTAFFRDQLSKKIILT